MSGKGSAPRPMPNPDKFRENFDLIFKKNDKNSPITERTLAQADTKTKEKESGS
jgi:hypothetical protein